MMTEKLDKLIEGYEETLIKEKMFWHVIGQIELFSLCKFPLEN